MIQEKNKKNETIYRSLTVMAKLKAVSGYRGGFAIVKWPLVECHQYQKDEKKLFGVLRCYQPWKCFFKTLERQKKTTPTLSQTEVKPF